VAEQALAELDAGVESSQAAHAAAMRDAAAAAEIWPHGEAAARERCAEDPRDETRLRSVANQTLYEALVAIGLGHDSEQDAPTDELLSALRRRREDENTPFPVVATPLRAYLDERSDHDTVLRERIENERTQTRDALDAAEAECEEMRAGLDRIQEAIQRQVESTIGGISEQFNELDREAGGYGACLRLDMQPPAGANDTWRWSVTPMWKRAPRGQMVAYNAPTNSAQDKLYTVNLVLAALLGVGNSAGKVLILDELGNSLDFEHRRSVLRAIAQTAARRGITVLGTCQDDIVSHATEFADEIIFFEYASDRDILNRPVRPFGVDPSGARVETTRDALLRGRPVV
jgi:chromosome segregation protein